MVRASVRFLLFTRRAAIIEIWSPPVEHDIEPKQLKSNNTSSLSLGSWSGHRVFILFSPLPTAPLPCPYGCSTEIDLKANFSFGNESDELTCAPVF